MRRVCGRLLHFWGTHAYIDSRWVKEMFFHSKAPWPAGVDGVFRLLYRIPPWSWCAWSAHGTLIFRRVVVLRVGPVSLSTQLFAGRCGQRNTVRAPTRFSVTGHIYMTYAYSSTMKLMRVPHRYRLQGVCSVFSPLITRLWSGQKGRPLVSINYGDRVRQHRNKIIETHASVSLAFVAGIDHQGFIPFPPGFVHFGVFFRVNDSALFLQPTYFIILCLSRSLRQHPRR